MNADKSTSRTFLNSDILRRSLGAYLSQARRTWKYLSPSLRSLPLGRAYGRHLDYLVRLYADRKQYFSTFFLRNRAELELMCRLVDRSPHGSRLDLSVLACSKGAEVYSIAWVIRSMRPDLQLEIHAVDISQEILNFAARGVYSLSNFGALPSLNEEIAKKERGCLLEYLERSKTHGCSRACRRRKSTRYLMWKAIWRASGPG